MVAMRCLECSLAEVLRRRRFTTLQRDEILAGHDSKLLSNLADAGASVLCMVPLVSRGKVIGLIIVSYINRDEISGDQESFLEEIAAQVATSVDNARANREMAAPLSLDEVKLLVHECLTDRGMRDWFIRKEERIVLREQDLTNRDGALYRADRIIIDPKTVTVVDFKTGGDEGENDYLMQVKNYMEMLKEIYPDKEVLGCLAYVDLKKVRSVS